MYVSRDFDNSGNKKITWLYILAILFYSSRVLGQNPPYKNYTTNDGLPGNNVYSAIQDDLGFIWFCTDNGVSRFDGSRFKNYSATDGLSDNSVLKIAEDSFGRIWFLTFNGKLSFIKNNKIYNASNCDFLKKLNFTTSIEMFCQDSKKNIWIGSYGERLAEISPNNEVKMFYNVEAKLLWEGKDGSIKTLSSESVFTKKDTSFVRFIFPQIVRNGIFLPGDSLIILIEDKGLKLFKPDSSFTSLKGLENYNVEYVSNMYIDKNKNFWISSINGATEFDSLKFKIDRQHKYFEKYSINSIFQDNRGNYWFCSSGNGVFMVPKLNIKQFDESAGLIDNNVVSLAKLNDYKWLIGSHNGNVQIIDHGKVTWPKKPLLTTRSRILKIEKDQFGTIWLITDAELFKFNNDRFSRVPDSSRWYKSILVTKDGTCWVGKGRGLYKIKQNRVVKVKWTRDVNRIYAMVEKGNNEFFLGTDKGLFYYKNGDILPLNNSTSFIQHRINALALTKDSTLWIATNGYGLLSLRNNVINHFSVKEHLSSDYCNTLLADSNKIYVGTDKGLNIIEDNKKIISYTTNNGLIINQINEIIKKSPHVFLLATDQGVVEFDERDITSPVAGVPYINEVFVNEHPVSLSGSLNFPYNENSIQIDFGNINFNTDGKTKFRYKLTGADSSWNYSSAYSVKYSFLHPGNYKFIVTSQNADGNWASKQATLQFNIQTPWWQTWWFRTLFVLCVAAIIGLIINWRLNAYRLKLNQQQAILESELKALRAQINPHFIFNSLNSIQDFILLNQKEDAHLYLSKFASLMRNILSHSRTQQIPLSDEIQSLELYMELEALRFNHRFTFHFFVDEQINTEDTLIPSMVLQPFIENAILHGLAPVKHGGLINISFRKNNNLLIATIEDNGVGRKKAIEEHRQRIWKSHKSLGMQVTQERLDMIGAYQKDKINLEIIDLVDEQNNARGTKVIISFPIS